MVAGKEEGPAWWWPSTDGNAARRRAVPSARSLKSAYGNAKSGRRVMARGTFGIPAGVRDRPIGGTTIRTRQGREG